MKTKWRHICSVLLESQLGNMEILWRIRCPEEKLVVLPPRSWKIEKGERYPSDIYDARLLQLEKEAQRLLISRLVPYARLPARICDQMCVFTVTGRLVFAGRSSQSTCTTFQM
ncbi:hypothetical protein BC832DRAFT_39018 [Gaertneriomyces semiglobifer]|nr:hypothetical protein BC832DRAFT_39018 [Gaertneriomyces semiglobifer]